MPRGKFIVLEGADGSGTSTLTLLLQHLITNCKHQVKTTHEPSRGRIGWLIRRLLREHTSPLDWRMMSYLFMADRMQHVQDTIIPALEAGVHVICDRYYPSTLVYQSASAPPGVHPMSYLYDEMKGCNVERDRSYVDPAWLEPDLCLYLGVSSTDILKKRRSSRDKQEMYEEDDTQQKVLDWYNYWFHTIPGENVAVNADLDLDTVRRRCWDHVCPLLGISFAERDRSLKDVFFQDSTG